MARPKKVAVTVEQVKEFLETPVQATETQKVEPVVYDGLAYSIFQRDGTNKIIEIPFSKATLQTGPASVVEHNTDHYIVQERLQILLRQTDMA